MKSYKIFILSALTSVLFLGVAYASYWDLDVQTTSTVNTGELSITVESESVSTDDDYMTTVIDFLLDDVNSPSGGSGLQVDGNDLMITIDDMYPGANVEYQFDVRNSGSLGIFLADMTVECLPYGAELCTSTTGPELCSCGHKDLDQEIEMEFSYDGEHYLELNDFLEITQLDEISNGDARTYYVQIWFDRTKSNVKENELEDTKATYNLSINYKQFNKMSTPPSP